jgi:hypothetical protein
MRALGGSVNEHLPVSYNVAHYILVAHCILSSITGQCPITAGAGVSTKSAPGKAESFRPV